MSKTAIIIQARMNSKRLPGKSIMTLGDFTLIEWVINIAKAVNNVSYIFLATSKRKDCDDLCRIAERHNIKIIRGDENNVLSRYIKILNNYKIDNIIRITGDDPCHDTDLINKALEVFNSENYDYLLSSTYKIPLIDGLIFEIFKANLLIKINKFFGNDKNTQEHITINIRNKKLQCKKGYIPSDFINPIFIDKGKFKICIDEMKDYRNLKKVWQVKQENKLLPDTVKIIKNFQSIIN